MKRQPNRLSRHRRALAVSLPLTLALACACAHLPHRIAVPRAAKGKRLVQKAVLDNGLTLLIHQSRAHPLTTLDLWIGAGAAHESADLYGASNFLKHMLLKGAGAHGPGALERTIESLGGVWNADVGRDFTHYHLTVGGEHFQQGLAVLADTIANPTLDPAEFEKERGVILEELRREQDNPSALLREEIFQHAFAEGPYKHNPLGSAASLQTLKPQALRNFHQQHYAPENMTLVIAGDIDAKDAIAAARQAFAGFSRPYRPSAIAETRRPPGDARRPHVIEKDISELYLALAWPAPGIYEPRDVYAMDLLSRILGDGRASRLHRQLREERQLATAIGCSYPLLRRPSLLILNAIGAPENAAPLAAALKDEIARLRDKPVTRAELTRVKKRAVNQYLLTTETTAGAAARLGHFYTLTGDEAFERAYLKNLAKVTPAAIRRVARKYLKAPDAIQLQIRPHPKPE